MSGLLTAELLRLLLRRRTWVLLAGCLVVTGVVSLGYAVLAGDVAGAVGSVRAAEALVLVISRGSVAPLFAGLLAAVAVGEEFRHRTIDTALVLTPRRPVVFTAKLAAVGACAAVLGAASAGCAWAVCRAVLGSQVAAVPPGTAARLALAHTAFTVGCALVAGALAFLLRSQAKAVAVVLVYPLFLEPALRGAANVAGGGAVSEAARFLPWAAGTAMQNVSGADGTALLSDPSLNLSPSAGAVLFLTAVLALCLASGVSFSRNGTAA